MTVEEQKPLCTLGVDPGLDGAAVLLDPEGKVVIAVAWSSLSWSVRILPWSSGGTDEIHEHKVSNLHAVGLFVRSLVAAHLVSVRAAVSYRLAVEGLFGHGPTLAGLAWEAGLVVGPLLDGAVGTVERPLAMTWRPAVLGIRGNDKNAGALALKLAPIRFPGLGSLRTNEHACEAACIAEFVRTSDIRLRLPPQPSLPFGKAKRLRKKAAVTP